MTTSHLRPAKLQELPEPRTAASGPALFAPRLDLVQGVKVRLHAGVGHAEITVAELFGLQEGALLTLDRASDDPIEITLDGKLVALGELVVVDDHFGVRITRVGDAGGL